MIKKTKKLSHTAVLVLLVLSSFINYIDRGNLSIAAPMLKEELGISATQLGLLLSSFFWTYATFQIISGWLVDRFSVNWILASGFLLWSSATAATGFARTLTALFVFRMLLGIGESAAYPCYSKIFARHFPEQRRGFANALIAAATSGGSAFGLLGGGMLLAVIGWRPFFIVFGSLSLLWVVPWLYWMPRGRTPGPSTENTFPEVGILDLLNERSVWGTCAGLLCVNYVSYFLITWLPFYLVRERHFSMSKMAEVGGGAYLIAGVSAAFSGWLSDRWISAGGAPTVVRKAFIAAGLMGSGIFLVICVDTAGSSAILFLLIASAAYGMCASNVWAITQTLAGQAVGKWTGLQNFVGNFAGVMAPAITGFVVDTTGHFLWAFVITASVTLIGSGFWLFLVGPIKAIEWKSNLLSIPSIQLRS